MAVTQSAFLKSSLAAVSVAACAVLPLFLVGALGIQLSRDLDISAAGLGVASAAFFGTAAFVSPRAGAAVERFGVRAMMRLALLIVGATLLGIGGVVNSQVTLFVLLGLGGAGNALAQLSVNQYLARRTLPHQQGAAYGIKQSGIPAAGMLAGLAVPALGITLGWRWTFVLFALPVLALAASPPGTRGRSSSYAGRRKRPHPHRRMLYMISTSAALAAASASCLPVFLVSGAVASGWSETQAGLIFAIASGIGIGARLLWGVRADRRGAKHLEALSVMLMLGALGFTLLASERALLYPLGAAVAFALGWGWTGLLYFTVVQISSSSPAEGTAVVQVGNSLGAVIGPMGFGVIIERHSYALAWSVAAALLILSAIVMSLARGTR